MIFAVSFVRWIVIVDVAVLLTCGLWSNVVLREAMAEQPKLWRHYLAGFGHAVFELSVALGVIANIASTLRPTPSTKVIAVVGTPAALWVAYTLFWRRRNQAPTGSR